MASSHAMRLVVFMIFVTAHNEQKDVFPKRAFFEKDEASSEVAIASGGDGFMDATFSRGRMLALRNRASGQVLRASELWNGGRVMSTKRLGPDEWWAVDGEILRLRPEFGKGYTLVNMEEPDPRPKPLNYKKIFGVRMTRMQNIRIRDNTQEGYWEAYMERFNRVREDWEKLFWDGALRAPDQDPVAKRPIDHYQILGLRKRHQPYSPLELKAAFRDKAMLFHPENNREKDPKRRAANMAKFRQVWESYKNLQNRRSW